MTEENRLESVVRNRRSIAPVDALHECADKLACLASGSTGDGDEDFCFMIGGAAGLRLILGEIMMQIRVVIDGIKDKRLEWVDRY